MTRNLLIALAILLIIGGIAKYVDNSGYERGVASVKPKLDKLQAQVDATDLLARNDAKRYKENFDVLKKDNASRVARITAHYDRLLHAQAGDESTTASAGSVDGASSQQGTSGCTVAFERACILDANKVTAWQEFAILNKFPIQ